MPQEPWMKHAPMARLIACAVSRRFRRRVPAEDLYAVALGTLATVWPKFDGRGDFAGFARVMIRRDLRDFVLRDLSMTRSGKAPALRAEGLLRRCGHADPDFEQIEARDFMDAYVHRLPRHQRTVIELRLGGLDPSQIAERLGKHRGCVDSAVYGAVRRMRAMYEEDLARPKARAEVCDE